MMIERDYSLHVLDDEIDALGLLPGHRAVFDATPPSSAWNMCSRYTSPTFLLDIQHTTPAHIADQLRAWKKSRPEITPFKYALLVKAVLWKRAVLIASN